MSVREHVVFMDVLIRSAGAGDQNSGDCDPVIVVGGGDWDYDSLTQTENAQNCSQSKQDFARREHNK